MFMLDSFNYSLDYTCGGGDLTFNGMLPGILSTAINIIKIVVPILLIIFGMLDLGKAVMAQKEDEIKKGQQTFIKRCIAAAIVFFVFIVVQLIVGVIAGDQSDDIRSCMNCFINGNIGPNGCTVK